MNERMVEYLNEISKYDPHITFEERNYQEFFDVGSPTIHFPREVVLKWRVAYEILNETLAHIVGVKKEDLCILDLLRYFYKEQTKLN